MGAASGIGGRPRRFPTSAESYAGPFAWARPNGVDLMLSGHNHGGQIVLPVIGPVFAPSKYGVRYASGSILVRSHVALCFARSVGATASAIELSPRADADDSRIAGLSLAGKGVTSRRLTLVVPPLELGGAERVVPKMANHWAASGEVVTVITLSAAMRTPIRWHRKLCGSRST